MSGQRIGQARILLVSVIVLWSSAVYGLDPSLVLYLPFDDVTGGQAKDLSQYGNNGRVDGNPAVAQGQFGAALLFDATNDQVVVPTNATLDIDKEITMMVWAKPGQNLTADWRTLIGKGPTSVLGNNTFSYDIRTDNTGIIRFSLNLGGTWRYILGPTFTQDTWYHVAGTYNSTQMVLYINGESVGTLPITGTIRVTTDPVCIGNMVNAAGAIQNEYWSGVLDEVRIWNRPLSQAEVKTNMQQGQREMLGAARAYEPGPANLATDVLRDTVLTWKAGEFAQTHDVYLGTAFADVNDAGRTSPKGVLVGQGQTETTYNPALPLAYGQTYFWRVDEVNGAPDNTVHRGDVWSFTVEPYAYPVQPIAATASSSQANMGPEKTIDGSGLTGDLHGVEPSTMWMSAGMQPNWIQYEFDKVYKLHKMQVWNSNQMIEPFLGFGAKNVTIETSVDGVTWTPMANVPEFAQAPGAPNYAANTTVNLGGAEAKYVKMTIDKTWGGVAPQAGLAEVRFSAVPLQAREPQPATGATDIGMDAALAWRPGREAASHAVYFGTDPNAVASGTVAAQTVTEHAYTPDSLNYGTTYYWRVDEVNTVTHPGDVWSFTTQEYQLVDDFEGYTDQEGGTVYEAWLDGYADQSSGSIVGLIDPVNGTFCETTIVHGGRQSMPLAYDNTAQPYYSEGLYTFDTPQDWTAHGIKSLSLWFRGVAGNTGQLYVKVNSTKVSYDGDAADLARPTWQVWNIDLAKAGKVNSVRSLVIGIEGAGAKGTLYIDDIRLYPKTPEYYTPALPADTDLLVWWPLDEGKGTVAVDHSGNGHNGAFTGDPQWAPGHDGSALHFDGVDDSAVYDFPAPESMSAFTLLLWVKADQVGQANYASPFAGYNPNTAGFQLDVDGGTPGQYRINPPGLLFGPASTDWVCLSLAANGRAATLYYNGIPAATGTLNDTQWDEFCLGVNRNRNTFWAGAVDDFRVYNRALTAAEVAGLAGLAQPLAQPF